MEYSFEFAEWKNQEKTIRASLYRGQNKNAPWVILCHGFTSHRIGPNYFFTSLARSLASEGICANAFDFTGCGESDGMFSDITISSLCSDCISAYNFIKENYTPTKVILLGHSFGGTISVLSLNSISIDGLILISPLADIDKHAQSHEYVINNGTNEEGCYEFGPHEMKVDFLKEMKACDPMAAFSKNAIDNMIIFQGDNDQQISIEESSAYLAAARQQGMEPDYHLVRNADHTFSSVVSRKILQQAIVAWIKEKIL